MCAGILETELNKGKYGVMKHNNFLENDISEVKDSCLSTDYGYDDDFFGFNDKF